MTTGSSNKNNNPKNILSRINKQFLSEMKIKIGIFFDSLKGVLYIFQQNSDDNYKQSLNNVAIQTVIDNQKKIETEFLTSINNAFTYFNNGDYDFFINGNLNIRDYHEVVTRPSEGDELAIISMLIKKSDEINDVSLSKLAHLFSEMSFGRDITIEQIPLSPFVVVNSLVNSIKDIDLSSGIRMIIYNTFDVHVLTKLGNCYLDIINTYKKRIFDLNVPNRKKPKLNDTLDLKYTIITKLYAKYHVLNKTKINTANVANVDEVLIALNILQKKILEKERIKKKYSLKPQDIHMFLKKAIQKIKGSAGECEFSVNEYNKINFIEMFFLYIEFDQSIPVVLKEQIMKLHVPLLKVAIQNISVFKFQTNPLRQLINKMSYVPEGFADELSGDHKYVIKVKEIVAVIISQSSYNVKLYENLLDEMKLHSRKMKKKFDLVQKRVKEKAIGLEKISQIKLKVSNLLEDKMHDKMMPIFIRELLLKTWKNVLVLEFLRHPENSKTCQSKVDFIDLILRCSQSKASELVTSENVKEILIKFKQGLGLVAFNGKDLNDKANDLGLFLNKLHKLEEKTADIDKINISNHDYELMLFTKKEMGKDDRVSSYSQKDNGNVEVGTWLDILCDKAGKIRAKISWVSPITGRYLLVNSNGVRMADMSAKEISEGIQNNKISPLQVVPLFDRAMLEIAKKMNESMF